MYSRTYDAQRYSPLNQINKQNAGRLTQVWSNLLPPGTIEIIPIVHDGVMYIVAPSQGKGTAVQALDATNGQLIWEYKRPAGGPSRAKTLGIFEDLILFAAPDGFIAGLDARTGQLRWETKTSGSLTAGTIVFGDKVLSGRSCTAGGRVDCYIVAHDARTGKEVWRFYTVAGSDVICAYNTKSYWPMSYHPGKNSLYVPYVDNCLDMTRANGNQPERRTGVRRPGSDPEKFGGIAKINMTTGEIQRLYEGRAPGNGATLVTAGDVVFWGDLNQKFRAFDAGTGKILWETALGGPIQNSTITYRVNGRQYVAVVTGLGAITANLFSQAGINPQRNNAIHAFALGN